MSRSIEVLVDREALVLRAQELVEARITQAIADRGLATLVLSGGSTPKPLYEALAKQPLPWDKIHIFWGDERYVPADHPDSNQQMARSAWLDQVPFPAENLHPMPTDDPDPAHAAQRYQIRLQKFFQQSSKELPQFDLILLGMGDDGHTASLFPNTPVLKEQTDWVGVGNKEGQPRLTLTAPIINQARCVMFLVSGASKQAALAKVFAPEGNAIQYPARMIQPKGELLWLLDEAAGKDYRA